MFIDIPDSLGITLVNAVDLQTGWRDFRDYSKCQSIGNAWYDKAETPVLKVPSAVLPANFNYVINTTHPDYKKITLAGTTELMPDERIEKILKEYGG